jgi:hypothetical protein
MAKPKDWSLSPQFRSGDFPAEPSDEQKIAIFEDRISGWMLAPTERLLQRDPDSGFAALAILGTYFEMIAKYEDGCTSFRTPSRRYFVRGLQRVLNTEAQSERISEKDATDVYDGLRSGLYHWGFPTPSVAIDEGLSTPIARDPATSVLMINPSQMLFAVRAHFAGYLERLRMPGEHELRRRFEQSFTARNT